MLGHDLEGGVVLAFLFPLVWLLEVLASELVELHDIERGVFVFVVVVIVVLGDVAMEKAPRFPKGPGCEDWC